MTEDELSGVFAESVKKSPQFCSWVLNRTKFGKLSDSVHLLHEEQLSIRPRNFWWKDWWCNFPGQTKKGGQIDIFMVFAEIRDDRRRFSLHVENKKANGKFLDGQAKGYSLRARHMANKPEYLNYQDYETMLIAPLAFRKRYGAECDLFDRKIPYEDIAKFIPEFGNS